jgi:hypothetical protein
MNYDREVECKRCHHKCSERAAITMETQDGDSWECPLCHYPYLDYTGKMVDERMGWVNKLETV